jgi:hypothetical protein
MFSLHKFKTIVGGRKFKKAKKIWKLKKELIAREREILTNY